MICDKCNTFFQPTPEEERLIVAGAMPGICTKCASDEWRETVKPTHEAVIYPGYFENLGHGNEMWHALRFDAQGRQMCFLRVKPRPIKPPRNILREDKPWDIKVFVMSENASHLRSNPPVRLHTNIDVYQQRGEPLWIRKIPSYQDAITGAAHITVPHLDVEAITSETVPLIDAEHTHIHVALKDGGKVLIKYR